LELSEQTVRSIVQTANDAIVCIDSRGQVVLWNRKAEDIFGYSSGEAVGRSFDFVAFRKLNGGQGNIVLAELTTGEPEEVACLRKNRTEFPAEISIAPWKGKEGEFFTVIVRDITERKRAEEALKENEKRFRSTFEQAAVGIAHVALDGRYVRANHKICDILGYSGDEFVDLTFRDITHPDDLGRLSSSCATSGEANTFCSEKEWCERTVHSFGLIDCITS
jgi:two-component system sensor histidine kinase UhpB